MRVMPWLVVLLKSAAVLPGKREEETTKRVMSGASASATQTNTKKQPLTVESASNAGHGTLVVDRTAKKIS